MIKTIYFDESGFTGYNYLDPLQPVFTLASTDIQPDVAKAILSESFPNYKGAEFKFSSLWKSRRKDFLTLAGKLASYSDGIFFWVVDKPFAVVVKMVDFLIEPGVTAAGYNFLADGFGRKTVNYLYVGLKYVATPGCLERLVEGYQIFSRDPSIPALNQFREVLKEEYERQSLEVKPLLGQLLDGANNFEKHTDLETFRATNDLQFTTMLAAVADWRKRFQEDFVIIHDASSNFLRQKENWNTVTSTDVPKQMHPLGDGTTVEFPLRVLETHSVNSKDNYSVQLCDLLAGFASRYFNPQKTKDEQEILEAIAENGLGSATTNGIRVGKDFPTGPPQKLDGPDAVDLMLNIMKLS